MHLEAMERQISGSILFQLILGFLLPATLKSVNGGGSLVLVGDTVYALRGGGDSGESNVVDFWKYSTTYLSSGTFTSAALDTGGEFGIWEVELGVTLPPSLEYGFVGLWHMDGGQRSDYCC